MRRSISSALRASCFVVIVVAGSVAASTASAHPELDEGVRRYEEADFDGALAALERAEASGELERPDLLRLLATRALVFHALDRSEEMHRALSALLSIEPDYELGPRAPPGVRRAADRVRRELHGPIELRARVEAAPGGVRLVVRERNDIAGLVDRIDVAARTEGSSRWRTSRDGSVVLSTSRDPVVEYHATAIGPGGTALVRLGTPDDPQRIRAAGAGEPDARGDATPWGWIAAGAVVAVAAGVVIAVLVSSSSQSSGAVLEPPVWDRGVAP